MSEPRVVVETPCEHMDEVGVPHDWVEKWQRWVICGTENLGVECEAQHCPGGSRRVLDPGSLPDHVVEAAAAELTLDDYACQDDPEGGLDMVKRSLRAALDALAGGEQP